jgi:lysophospholipase L1-like esterase
MIDCMILGDSIAVGTHQYRPECIAYAKGGINSQQWRKEYLEGDKGPLPIAKTAIISLGSNDHKGISTRDELEKIRAAVNAEHVYWILPHGNNPASNIGIDWIQIFVKVVAGFHNDTILPINRVQSDNIHPSSAGYKELAEKTKNGNKSKNTN